MKPLSPQAKESLAAYRREHALPPALRERTLRALAARIECGDRGSEQVEAAAPRHPLLRWSSRWGWALSTVALLGGLGLVGSHLYVSPRIAERADPRGNRVTVNVEAPGARERSGDEPREQTPALASTAMSEHAPSSRGLGEPTSAPPEQTFAVDRVAPRTGSVRKARGQRGQGARETPSARDNAAATAAVAVEPERAASAEERAQVPEAAAPAVTSGAASVPVTSAVIDGDARAAHAGRARIGSDRQDSAFEPANDRSAPPASPASFVEPSARRAPDRAPPGTLDEEVLALRKAYDLLRAREPLRALSALAEYARRFPDGKLTAIRDVARIHALCDLGKRAQAREHVARFIQEHAGSPEAARVRRICAEAP